MPLLGVLIFFDGLAVAAHGILRGIGRQRIGGPVNILAHYIVSMPMSYILGFWFDWKIKGLYTGLTSGLVMYVSDFCIRPPH